MKKSFRFLALSFALICGTLSSWAGPRPADGVGPANGTKVGATVNGGVVTYNVVGWDATLDAYQVQITGLDYDGLNPAGGNPVTELNIKTSFDEKFGENKYKYYVVEIIDTDKDSKQAFWAMTQLKKLVFAADKDVISADKFTFRVGNYAFYGCTSLAELTLPDNVNAIGKYAFQNTAITNFTIPAKCATIGENAFYNAQSLDVVEVSAAGNEVMTVIGPKVFANSSVSKLDLTNAPALTMIADEAFIYDGSVVNNQLATIILPAYKEGFPGHVNGHTSFVLFDITGLTPGYEFGTAFSNLTGLTSIQNLEISFVSLINNGAFENCESLPILNFPASASIAAGGVTSAFLNCPKLKKLTFADGWYGSIAPNVYLSATGKKVVTKDGVTKFEAYTVTPAIQAKELSYLEEIEFKGAWGPTYNPELTTICAEAFGNNTAELACSGLKSVTFGGTIYEGASIGAGAFWNCAALATVTFNGFCIDKGYNNIIIDGNSFANTAIAEVDFKGFNLNGDNSGNVAITIQGSAFAADNLKKVTFGNIEWGKCYDVTAKTYSVVPTNVRAFNVAEKAFVSDLLTEVEFGNVTACNYTYDQFTIGATGANPAFMSKSWGVAESATRTGVLQKVKFADLTPGTFSINKNAFASEALTNVEFGKIVSPAGVQGELNIGDYAFGWDIANRGTAAQEKSVKISDINAVHTVPVPNNTLTVNVGKGAFAGDKLKKVEIGAITDEYTTFTASDYAFANTMANDDKFTAMLEEVEIGHLDKATVQLSATTFQGPAKDMSGFKVTIGKVNLKVGSAIAANAFVAPAKGSALYYLGDIENTSGIAGGAFAGSVDEEGKSNTTVIIGAYKAAFANNYTFTNVKDLIAASWNANSYVAKVGVPYTATITGDVTKDLWGDKDEDKITDLTIGGNVTSPASINNFGDAVRNIVFASDDPEVYAGAIKAGAFAEASDAAGNVETVSVIYRVKTAKKSNSIFDVNAFGINDTYTNVVLYTDTWSKANTFENVEIVGNPGHIYRMQLSASDVAPGEPIVASCITGANGKYAYGRLYVPAGTGMLYKVNAQYNEETKKNGVNLFYGNISGTNIYMNTVRQMDGYYWIDATEVAQTLIVRTSEVGAAAGEAVQITAESVTEAEKAQLQTEGIVIAKDWFGAAWADMNDLQYATQDIVNAELQNNTKFKKKGIYVMANPKKNDLAFALLDQYKTPKQNMSKGSVYVITRADQYEARLNVIWPEDDEESAATAIQSVKNVESNDAIYNLQGVRLNKAQKGINIINGKKVIK